MEQEVVTISWIGGFVILSIMVGMAYVGLYLNKPFPWEDKD